MKKFSSYKFVFLISFLCLFSCNANKAHIKEFNVKDFGAKGDGFTDDYFALKETFEAVNKFGSGKIVFPKGNYFINQYHDGTNNLDDLVLENLSYLQVKGNQSVITLKGNFIRSKKQISNIIPISITNSRNILIQDLEIDGNVDLMSRKDDISEYGGHLIKLVKVEDVNLKNLNLHHAQTDGLYITGMSSNLRAEKVTATNNARQGMSIIELKNSTFIDCQFSNTGITGRYGRHKPSAGVDIEPHSRPNSVIDVKFENCTFENNLGAQFVASDINSTRNVTLKNCKVIRKKDNARLAVISSIKNMIFLNCYFELDDGVIYPVYNQDGATTKIQNSVIKSSFRGIAVSNKHQFSSVVIENSTLEYIGKEAVKTYFPYIQMQNLEFVNNKIIIPEKYFTIGGDYTGIIQKAKKVSNNRFVSNGKEVFPKISYKGSNKQDD